MSEVSVCGGRREGRGGGALQAGQGGSRDRSQSAQRRRNIQQEEGRDTVTEERPEKTAAGGNTVTPPVNSADIHRCLHPRYFQKQVSVWCCCAWSCQPARPVQLTSG